VVPGLPKPQKEKSTAQCQEHKNLYLQGLIDLGLFCHHDCFVVRTSLRNGKVEALLCRRVQLLLRKTRKKKRIVNKRTHSMQYAREHRYTTHEQNERHNKQQRHKMFAP